MKTFLPVGPFKSASTAALPKPCGSKLHGLIARLTGLFERRPDRAALERVVPVCSDLSEPVAAAPLGCLGAWLAINGGIK